MSLKRAVLAALAVAAVAPPSTALAAPPPNDTPAGATVIALPFQEPVTLDGATTDAFEAALDEQCGAPADLPTSIWFRLDATRDTGIIVDPGDTHSVVMRGDPADGDVVACGFGLFDFPVTAGQTYYLMLSMAATTGSGVFTILQRYEIDLTVDRLGAVDRATGAAVITGTVACTYAEEPAGISVSITQERRRSTVTGAADISVPCGPVPVKWSVTVLPVTGRFRRGRAFTTTRAAGGSRFGSDEETKEARVRLRRARWRP